MENKNKLIIYGLILLVFISSFLFKIIPIPVENMVGANSENFIYGGLYFTSGLENLELGNYTSFGLYLSMFIVMLGGVYKIK